MVYTVILSLDLWPWILAVCRRWHDDRPTLHQIWTPLSKPRRSYCDFNIWPNDLEHWTLRVALGSGICFTSASL